MQGAHKNVELLTDTQVKLAGLLITFQRILGLMNPSSMSSRSSSLKASRFLRSSCFFSCFSFSLISASCLSRSLGHTNQSGCCLLTTYQHQKALAVCGCHWYMTIIHSTTTQHVHICRSEVTADDDLVFHGIEVHCGRGCTQHATLFTQQRMSPIACLPRHDPSLLRSRTVMASQVISYYNVQQPTSSGLAYVALVEGSDRPHVLIKHFQAVYL